MCGDRFGDRYFLNFLARARVLGMLALIGAMSVSACSGKEKKLGQALVRVDSDDITVHQLNAELVHANASLEEHAGQKDAMRKQILEALIDRQVLLSEALRNKMDRDPNVIQAIERFKAQILAQAYLQKKITNLDKPGKAEIDDYYRHHPEFFARRRVFEMKQLIVAAKDFNAPLNTAMDAAKSLDDVAAWLDLRKIEYARSQSSPSTADLPPEILGKLERLEKGQLFVLKDGLRNMLCSLVYMKDSPVTEEAAAPQIERYLLNKKSQEVATAEIARLRASAKLEYLGKSDETVVEERSAVPGSAAPVSEKAVATALGKTMQRSAAPLK